MIFILRSTAFSCQCTCVFRWLYSSLIFTPSSMKLFIEVEISPEEIPLATELFRTLRALTDHVKARDIGKLFQKLISRLEDSSQWDVVANEICTLLTECSSPEMVFDDFSSAFMQVVFPSDISMRPQNVEPFIHLLPRISEPMKTRMRDFLTGKVVKHLTIRRPANANRSDFLTHAEAFVALVKLEVLPLIGAVSTICMLLQKPEHRCAGITVLERIVEQCLPLLSEKCDSAALSGLIAALRIASEEVAYQNDIERIGARMGWIQLLQPGNLQHDNVLMPSSPSLSDSNLRSPIHGLFPLESYVGHKNTVFTMAYDEQRNELVSSGKDGVIITWTQDGEILETMDLHRHYACSMDIHRTLETLLVCGVAMKEEAGLGNHLLPAPCIFRYKAVKQGWKEYGILAKESCKLISSIKAISGGDRFVTAETGVLSNTEGSSLRLAELVCYYDVHSSFASVQPVKKYAEHEDLVTCISLFPPSQSVFMSGSRDCTIRVWDCRVDRCVGMLGVMGKTGKFHAHDSMITSLDADDSYMVLSCGLDGYVNQWDFRGISSKTVGSPVSKILLDGTLTLRAVLGGAPGMAAVNTVKGLYLVDFNQREARLAETFHDKRVVGTYHELKWAPARKVLYAAGDQKRIDVYKFQ